MNLPLPECSIPFEVFQNIGVWGLDGVPLIIDCDNKISQLDIFIDTSTEEFLNIRSVVIILSNDECVDLSSHVVAANLSSNYYLEEDGTLDVTQRLIGNNLIHSRYEKQPTLSIKLIKPLDVKKIKIFNRNDVYGLRSRYIAVNAYHEGEMCFEFKNVSNELRDRLYFELNAVLASYSKPIVLPKDKFSAAGYIRAIVAEVVESGVVVSDFLINSLLPLNSPMPRLDRLSAIYISKFIESKLAGKTHINTRELKAFNSILCDDVAVDALAYFATDYLNNGLENPQKVVIAKHRIHYDTLVAKREAHLDFLDEILLSLSELEAIPIIAYGTLLGAYRDGSFLPADDDLDMILYFPNVKYKEEKESIKKKLLEYLISKNLSANFQAGCPHITVNSKTESIGVDIFPAWDTDDSEKISVVMEQLKFRDVERDTLLPTSEIKLYGRTYPSPANVEGFLADRYGKGWYRSNPYHEWSWNMIRRQYFNDDNLSKLYDFRESNRHLRAARVKTQMIAWSQCVSKTNRPPSNSVPMLLQAIEYGYDVVELDIRCSVDGDIVLAHDDLIQNSAGEAIYLTKSTLNEITNFKLGVYEGKDVYLTTLDTALPYLNDKKVLLDARFAAEDYEKLRVCIDKVGFDRTKILFCVYSADQIPALMRYFPESLYFWKFYTQAWEIDPLLLKQIRQYGVDGVMYMYPHHDEDITESLYNIRNNDLQSMCFIHGQNWTPPHSSGLSPKLSARSKDNYKLSLKKMLALGIEYVTSVECREELNNK